MATTEERVDKMETRFATLEQQVSTVTAKVDMIIQEMRDRDNQRAAEIMELRQQHNADMKEMREDIKGALKHIQGLTIASMVGIAAIAIATWVFVLTDAKNEPPPNPPAPTQTVEQAAK